MSLLEKQYFEPVVGFSADSLRRAPMRDLAVRFAFGAAISIVASLISIFFGFRVGGLMLAFPVILPATLTLIEQEESEAHAAEDDVGSTLGAVGLAAFGAVAWWLLPRAGGAVALVAAAMAWLGTSTGLYFGIRAIAARCWRRGPPGA